MVPYQQKKSGHHLPLPPFFYPIDLLHMRPTQRSQPRIPFSMPFPPLHLQSPSQLPPQLWIDPLSPTVVIRQILQQLAGTPAPVYYSQDLYCSLDLRLFSKHLYILLLAPFIIHLCHLIPPRRQLPSWDFPHNHPCLSDLTLVTGLTAQASDTTPTVAV